jgi:hypothetical protein
MAGGGKGEAGRAWAEARAGRGAKRESTAKAKLRNRGRLGCGSVGPRADSATNTMCAHTPWSACRKTLPKSSTVSYACSCGVHMRGTSADELACKRRTRDAIDPAVDCHQRLDKQLK